MNLATETSLENLRSYCASLQQENQLLRNQNAEIAAKVQWLEEQFRLAQHRRFGASSERSLDGNEQVTLLFDEAEVVADPPAVEEPELEAITVKRRKRRGQRDIQLENLPVERVDYRLSEDEMQCIQCQGALHEMSVKTRRELVVIPVQVKVTEHVQHVYSCRHCEREAISTPVVTAPMPAPPIPGSLASPSALGHVIAQKYAEALPLYRQAKQFSRNGVEIPRQTLGNWVLEGTSRWLDPLYARMREVLLAQDILHADETTLQVLKEPGRDDQTQSYMWLYRTGREGPPIALFEYQMTRAREHPKRFLDGFSGFLHADAYSGYDKLPGITVAGCWSHARRNFDEAIIAMPHSARSSGRGSTPAEVGLEYCNALFKIEQTLKDVTASQRMEERTRRSKPLLDKFKEWLDAQAPIVTPKSKLGQAIGYCQNQWGKLTTFLLDGRLELDNNRAERTIKPFVIGRKNWLFSGAPRGAKASAIAYSVVETAKENGLNPVAYLTYLFEQLPNRDISDPASLDALLPWSQALPDNCHVPSKRHASRA